ncbi:MAG: type-F conjugative transfer system secretin TraK [Deferribacteraceae bacterium]|jgi:hypothetical protein|nr:type-F conjugative transfer system secretin TraK [Deferribacteraceae bacterium]
MRRFIILTIISAVWITQAYGETYTVSSKSINSITCPDGQMVTDIFASEKSQLKIETRKDKLFFEFMATKIEVDGYVTMNYATDSTSIALFCGDEEYSVTLVPRQINGTSVYLSHKPEKMSKLDGLKREEQLSRFVQMIFMDETRGFKTVSGNKAVKFGDKEVYLRKIHTVGSYRLKELYIYSEILGLVTESDLLSLPFIVNPVAMTLPDHFVGWQRVVVVEEVINERQ